MVFKWQVLKNSMEWRVCQGKVLLRRKCSLFIVCNIIAILIMKKEILVTGVAPLLFTEGVVWYIVVKVVTHSYQKYRRWKVLPFSMFLCFCHLTLVFSTNWSAAAAFFHHGLVGLLVNNSDRSMGHLILTVIPAWIVITCSLKCGMQSLVHSHQLHCWRMGD